MFVVWFTLITLLLYLCVTYFTGKPHPKFPPGPYRWPIWGGYLQLLWENYKFPHLALHWMSRRYNTEILGMYLGPYPSIVACSPNSVRDILNHPNMQGRLSSVVSEMRDPDGVTRGSLQ
uniref:Cytochrome P450 n=1 Tax=Cuerna arida TaxID=1464854 RepID=A0A1B6ERT2_9HEMI